MTTKTEEKPLHIVSLQAENVKRLVAIRIDPKGRPLVEITGKNGQGKTSVLDSIWWALGGLSNVQKSPIRKGQEKARIRLDLGELIVTRTFTKQEAGDFTSTIAVESAEGGRFPSPQRMLDGFLDSLAFDPLAFAHMKPKEQFDTLKGFVPGIDFAAIDNANRGDFAKRTDVNRRAKEAATRAAAIAIPESTPTEKVDEAAIVAEIASVGEHNATIERRREGREHAARDAAALRNEAATARDKALDLRTQADAWDAEAVAHDSKAAELEEKLKNAEPLPAPKDAAEVTARLEAAKRTNAAVDQAAKRAELQAEAGKLEKEAEEITARMEAREKEKREAIAAAKLPVEGLGFGEESITLNGVPFDQASDAEQLRASLAIAMASNPRLKVIRVRDGSLLDEDGLRLVAEMAAERGFQVWCERVDSSGKVGFVLDNGHVRATPDAPAAVAAE